MGINISELPEKIRRQAEKKYLSEIKKGKSALGEKDDFKVKALGSGRRTLSEAEEQEALFSWAEINAYKWPCLNYMFHVPNGGSRNPLEAAHLKRQGVKSGVSDIFLPFASSGFHGLFIELKAEGGKISSDQEEYIRYLRKSGYMAEVCVGAAEAEDLILKYLTKGKVCQKV